VGKVIWIYSEFIFWFIIKSRRDYQKINRKN